MATALKSGYLALIGIYLVKHPKINHQSHGHSNDIYIRIGFAFEVGNQDIVQ
jgi:hypothetical protein